MPIEKLRPSFTFTEDRLKELATVVPEAFADGKINWDVLREALGEHLEDEAQEHFGLFWPGKREARRLAAMPSKGTLIPQPGQGMNEDTTHNIFIEGDNLEVLKLLQKSYAGRIKLIYIDPPYNTGEDFIYPDNFTEPLEAYLQRTNQVDEAGNVLTSNTRASGRFHSNWLNMMYPRLLLSCQLLRNDGYIVVSIDDAEIANLLLVLNEILGEENHIATLVWDRNRKNDATFFSVGHEYMIIYSRNIQYLREMDVVLRAPKEGVDELRRLFDRLRQKYADEFDKIGEEIKKWYATFKDDDPRKPLARFKKVDERGPYRDDWNMNWPGGGGPIYDIMHPITGKPCRKPINGWRTSKENMEREISKGNIIFGPDESTIPTMKYYLFEKAEQVMKSVHYSYAQTATQVFNKLFDGIRIFDNPKHYADLSQIFEYLSSENDTILDFFAGSCSTAHAVLSTNHIKRTSRRFICIQLPEPVNRKTHTGRSAWEMGLTTIADIGRERIRRVIRQIFEESKGKLPFYDNEDLGFVSFALSRSFFKDWKSYEGKESAILETLFDQFKFPLIEGWQSQNLITEILLTQGFPLDSRIRHLPEYPYNQVQEVASDFCQHRLYVCLDPKIQPESVAAFRLRSEDVLVCLDSALSDEAKITLADRCNLKVI